MRECGHLALCVFIYPPIVDQANGHGVEKVQLLAAGAAGDDEARFFQHSQMFHDAETCHGQLAFELAQRLAVAREEQIQQKAAGRISQCLEYLIVVDHAADYR